jgi:cytochrome bd-type quinol oxidase subunit 2
MTDRQKERFGGIKWGSAFFGWLTAIGTAVLLTALVAVVGAAFDFTLTEQTSDADTVQTVGVAGAIVAAIVLLVAYYCGGYVAGRMARFNGTKQGIAVWVWTIVITVLAVILVKVAGAEFDVPTGLPQLPIDGNALTTAGVISALVALVVSLVGAILGGLAGMRFHRKVDRAGLDIDQDAADHKAETR